MASSFAANCPISGPTRVTSVVAVNLNGFAFDPTEGLFVPLTEEIDMFVAPSRPVSIVAPVKKVRG